MQNVRGENNLQNKEDHKSRERTNSHLYKNKFEFVGKRGVVLFKNKFSRGEIKDAFGSKAFALRQKGDISLLNQAFV